MMGRNSTGGLFVDCRNGESEERVVNEDTNEGEKGMKVKFDAKATGKNIRSCRKQWGWSKKELAERAGVAVEMVDHYERGPRTMNFYAIIHIANAMNVYPDWLLAWKLVDEE